ncbi:hypothetical protein BBP40_005538 [Aspergillus hancockii]|nr:hypothetical protein BBP40_005538 [Aspergillus hancockii]
MSFQTPQLNRGSQDGVSIDEWKIEQGLAGAKLPILDQSGHEPITILPQTWGEPVKDEAAIEALSDRDKLFAREKKEEAHKNLTSQTFPPNPEFQMGPIPDTNPVLPGTHWKLWHHTVGGELTTAPEDSWKTVLREKHPDMLHLLQFPYNGEAPKRLVSSKDKWNLVLDGLVVNPKSFTLDDLMDETRFPRVDKLITMQCSGTARYVGISLKKVIKACGGLVDGAKHLEFYGAETYFKNNEVMNYLVSVPWSKVKANEVLLCWEMNGEPLPKIHGYPLRVVVLGYIGARSVKWLYRIKAIKEPSRAPVQSKEYLYFPQQVGKHNQRPTDGIQIQEMPVSSAIMSPWNKQAVIHNALECSRRWNWGLHVTSSAYRISVYSINKSRPLTEQRLEKFEHTGTPLAPLTWPEEFQTQTWEEYEKFWKEHDPRDVDD